MPMDSTSSFTEEQHTFPDAELLSVGGTTSECYRVKLYGKLHFLKRLKPELRTHPQYMAALQKEFETGYRLEHPHLVHYAAKTDDGILMDYIDGETLHQFVKHHPDYFRHRKHADRFVRQLLSVVGYLHAHQIVHLDLKPDNILITRIGNDVKLIDLGFCYTDSYTDTMGRTDKYAAPEQKDGSSRVDVRTDIYAIGRILQTLPCADFYKTIIKHCTAHEPVRRFQTVDEIGRSIRSKALTRRILLSVGMLLAAILLAFLFWYRSQDSSVLSETTKEVSPPDTTIAPPTLPVEKVEAPIPDVMFIPSESQPEVVSITPNPEPENPVITKQDVSAITKTESPVIIKSEPPVIAKSDGATVTKPVIERPVTPSQKVPSQTTSSSSASLSESEMEKRISAVITPVFYRVMGSLPDSTWNRNTQQIYSDLSLPLLEQCGSEVRVLWNKLSRQYNIDEKTFYRQYAKVLTTLSNDLYDKMLKNAK